jgi:hypothetical protein
MAAGRPPYQPLVWRLPGSVLTVVGAGLLLASLFTDFGSWVGVVGAVLLAVGAICTGIGMLLGGLRRTRFHDPLR